VQFRIKHLLPVSLLAVVGCNATKCPSDAEIKEFFARHRQSLDKLVEMAKDDPKLTHIWRDGSFDTGEITKARGAEYLSVLKEMGLDEARLSSSHGWNGQTLEISPDGWIEGGTIKSIVYSKEDLARIQPEKPGGNASYASIEPNWFIEAWTLGGDD
jgi:hypothetical protein